MNHLDTRSRTRRPADAPSNVTRRFTHDRSGHPAGARHSPSAGGATPRASRPSSTGTANFAERMIQDLVTQGHATQLRARADTFDDAAHRPGLDYPGQASPKQLAAQAARCHAVAEALKNRASIVERWSS